MTIYNNQVDKVLTSICSAMRLFAVSQHSARDIPSVTGGLPSDSPASESDRRSSGSLMRVNHVGEVCAQALYEGQAITTSDDNLRDFYRRSAQEEADHLAWTRQRLQELGARPSLLNPLWFAGAFALGALRRKAWRPGVAGLYGGNRASGRAALWLGIWSACLRMMSRPGRSCRP